MRTSLHFKMHLFNRHMTLIRNFTYGLVTYCNINIELLHALSLLIFQPPVSLVYHAMLEPHTCDHKCRASTLHQHVGYDQFSELMDHQFYCGYQSSSWKFILLLCDKQNSPHSIRSIIIPFRFCIRACQCRSIVSTKRFLQTSNFNTSSLNPCNRFHFFLQGY